MRFSQDEFVGVQATAAPSARGARSPPTRCPADDPHQPPPLVIIDLADPQAFRHRASLDDRRLRGKPPGGANVTCYGTRYSNLHALRPSGAVADTCTRLRGSTASRVAPVVCIQRARDGQHLIRPYVSEEGLEVAVSVVVRVRGLTARRIRLCWRHWTWRARHLPGEGLSAWLDRRAAVGA